MSGKVGAYGTNSSSDTAFRKTWNEEEYKEKAKEKDKEAHDRAVEAEEYAKKGKRPPKKKDDLPKPTQLMQARDAPLELDKNLNKVIVVAGGADRASQPGFYCDICKRNSKDSVAYLDHINGRGHLRKLGQTTRVKKSTLNDVRLKIADLRAKTAESSKAKQYDFEARLKEIREAEIEQKMEKKRAKKEAKEGKKEVLEGGEGDDEMARMMGFGGFGTTAGK